MKAKIALGLCFYLCTSVLAGVPPRDDCFLSSKRSCGIKEPCPPGSLCVGGRCQCPIIKPMCPSGDIGRTCSIKKPCEKGYSCRLGHCCKDDGCPRFWRNDGVCNTQKGKQKCKSGYNCINNFCCEPRKIIDPVKQCPKGQVKVPGICTPTLPRPGIKVPIRECPKGSVCYNGICCQSAPLDDCFLSSKRSCSIKEPCPPGSRCVGGQCQCPIIKPMCPSGDIGRTCSIKKPCKKGYSCRLGHCCKDEGCPRFWRNDGVCNTQKGKQKCKSGYNCINNFCCQPWKIIDPVRQCPKGQLKVPGICTPILPRPGMKVPIRECPKGSTCYKGICCQSAVVPKCPKGEVQMPGVCEDLASSPVGRAPFPTCPKPGKCYRGICCRSIFNPPFPDPIKRCPNGQTQVPGTCLPISPLTPGKWPALKCPEGSTCFKGMCCRLHKIAKCQKGHVKVPGKCPKCLIGSKCYNGICCRPPPFPRRCPKVLELSEKEKILLCPVNKKSPDQCKTSIDCLKLRKGRLCCTDRCGRKYCHSPFIIKPPKLPPKFPE